MFDSDAPLVPAALAAARAFLPQLPMLEDGQRLTHAPLHWPVESWTQCDGHYNVEVVLESGAWVPKVTFDPRLNARDLEALGHPPVAGTDYAEHTYLRNSFGVGCAIAGMLDATASDFGPDPIQGHELEVFCATVAAVCIKYGLDAGDAQVVYTHAEAAIRDGYWPDRWDLARLEPSDAPLTPQEATATGNALRRRVHFYKAELLRGAA